MPFQEVPTPPMTPEWYARCQQAVQVCTAEGDVLQGGRACLKIGAVLGYRRLATILAWPPLVWGVEAMYRMVARHRPLVARWMFRRE